MVVELTQYCICTSSKFGQKNKIAIIPSVPGRNITQQEKNKNKNKNKIKIKIKTPQKKFESWTMSL